MRSDTFFPEQLIHHRAFRLRNEALRDQQGSSHHPHRPHQTCMDLELRGGSSDFQFAEQNLREHE